MEIARNMKKFLGINVRSGRTNVVATVRDGDIVKVETGPRKATVEADRGGKLVLRFSGMTKEGQTALCEYNVFYKTNIEKRYDGHDGGLESVLDVEIELSAELFKRARYAIADYSSQDLVRQKRDEFELYVAEQMKPAFRRKGIEPRNDASYLYVQIAGRAGPLASALTSPRAVAKARVMKGAGQADMEREIDSIARWGVCLDTKYAGNPQLGYAVYLRGAREYVVSAAYDDDRKDKTFFDYVSRARLNEIERDVRRELAGGKNA